MNAQTKKIILAALKSGFAYSIGLLIGNIVIYFLLRSLDATEYQDELPGNIVYVGVVLTLLIVALGAFVGGAIGGASLTRPSSTTKSRFGFAWRSGLSFGIVISLIMYPLSWGILLFFFYTVSETSSFKFDLIFGGFGVLIGALPGLILGLLTIGRRGVRWIVLSGGAGFGIGGLMLGYSLRRFLLTMTMGDFRSGVSTWVAFGLLFFGFIGGAAWGAAYFALHEHPELLEQIKAASHKRRHLSWVGVALLAFGAWFFLKPIAEAVLDIVTPTDAGLAHVLEATATGTHWADALPLATNLPDDARHAALAVNNGGAMGLAWSADDDVFVMMGEVEPINVSQSGTVSSVPQVAMDDGGTAHIVWQEADVGIMSSHCTAVSCTPPVPIAQTAVCVEDDVKTAVEPALALDADDNPFVVWRQGEQLLFSAATGEVDCVPVANGGQPRVDGDENGRFHLVYNQSGSIHTILFDGETWGDPSTAVGIGTSPEIMTDGQGRAHIAWCGDDGNVHLLAGQDGETTFAPSCQTRPALAQDEDGQLHLLWYGDEVVAANGEMRPQSLLYEAAQFDDQWTEPAIVSRTTAETRPSIAAPDGQGVLHLAWLDANSVQYTAFTPYNCDDYPLTGISQTAYETARDPKYRRPEDIIPYCQNQYQRLSYAPMAEPVFTDWPTNPNGSFDDLAALIPTAEYEVLFSTMWYEKDKNGDSPGTILAQSIGELYAQLKANPEQYPRGLTVRILLGNPPELELGTLLGQTWYVLHDLQAAGIDKMVDEKLGWRLEVANFSGTFPHSHTKILVIDGEMVLAAGYNMQYVHYPIDHPSGEGHGWLDLGVQATGPVAQSSHRVYDDLWEGAEQRVCADFSPDNPFWKLTCRKETAVADHVPEVSKFYIPDGGESTAFSLYRSEAHDEADQVIANSIAQAQHSVDAMHVMFAMEMECDLNIIIDVCGFQQAPAYLQGLVQAAENGAAIRLIIKPKPADGIESFIAVRIFLDELERRGLSDQVEIRLFNGRVHYKTVLIDDEFLVVGSQNFHYSAFGEETGLTEYNLGIADPQAVLDYQRLFATQWERAAPLVLNEE